MHRICEEKFSINFTEQHEYEFDRFIDYCRLKNQIHTKHLRIEIVNIFGCMLKAKQKKHSEECLIFTHSVIHIMLSCAYEYKMKETFGKS